MWLIILGLTATLLILYSQITLGWKKRYSFINMAVGNALWFYVAVMRVPFQFDLALASLIFFGLSVRNYIVWGKDTVKGGLS